MIYATKILFVWQRLIPEHCVNLWLERVAWVGSQNCVVSTFPSGKSAKLHVYGQTERCCRKLVKNYGGKLIKTKGSDWIKASLQPIILPFPPHLCVVSEGQVPKKWRHLPKLWIPAGMAFGTGDHATTGMCLRQVLQRCRGGKKRVLDLGTGSGILALAAAAQGHAVVAMDFDAESIRTAKANTKRNEISGSVRWIRADVKTWEPKGSKFDLIVANLFSSLLIVALPKMKRWLKPEGEVILSGVLKTQLPEVLSELSRLKLEVKRVLKKGKWVCIVVGS